MPAPVFYRFALSPGITPSHMQSTSSFLYSLPLAKVLCMLSYHIIAFGVKYFFERRKTRTLFIPLGLQRIHGLP